MMEEGGNIVDYHGCDFFPERWFDRVVVLQTENSVLFDRLSRRYAYIIWASSYNLKFLVTHDITCLYCLFNRGYTGSKLSNNIECEIFQVLLEEARESYPEDIVVALKNDTVDEMNANIATLSDWISSWSPMLSWFMVLLSTFIVS